MFVATFTIFQYGTSGNELPPEVIYDSVISIISQGGETYEAFRDRVLDESEQLQIVLNDDFNKNPNSYSRPDHVHTYVTQIGSTLDLLNDHMKNRKKEK